MFSNISKYDEAIKSLIEKVYSKEVVYEPVDTAFEYAFKQTNNESFPMISFFRDPTMNFGVNNFVGYNKGSRYSDRINLFDKDMNITGQSDRIRKKYKIFIYRYRIPI